MKKLTIPQFKDIPKFKSREALNEWLKKHTYKVLHFVDKQQDLLTMHIHHTGEILQVDAHSSIYIGRFVNMNRLHTSAPVEIFEEKEGKYIPYRSFVIEKITTI